VKKQEPTLPDPGSELFETRPLGSEALRVVHNPSPPETGSTKTSSAETKEVDGWHFQAHTMPPGLRIELATAKLPEIPAHQRYRARADAARIRGKTDALAEEPVEEPVEAARGASAFSVWFRTRWHLRERRTQIVAAFVAATALLFLFALERALSTSSDANPAIESARGADTAGGEKAHTVVQAPSSAEDAQASPSMPSAGPVPAVMEANTPLSPPAALSSAARHEKRRLELPKLPVASTPPSAAPTVSAQPPSEATSTPSEATSTPSEVKAVPSAAKPPRRADRWFPPSE